MRKKYRVIKDNVGYKAKLIDIFDLREIEIISELTYGGKPVILVDDLNELVNIGIIAPVKIVE